MRKKLIPVGLSNKHVHGLDEGNAGAIRNGDMLEIVE